jgi:hypothetical protein
MLTSMPTRFLASTGAHPAYASPWLESAPHTLDARRSLPIHTPDVPLSRPAELTAISFGAQSATSAHHEQLSIPIPLPR